MKLFICLFLAVVFMPQTTTAQVFFPTGEKLTYNVSFANFTDAAQIEIAANGKEKLNDREVYVVRARIRTGGALQAALFDLDDSRTTFLATETLLPIRAERFASDDGKTSEIKRDFAENQILGEANLHDLLSAFYLIRRANAPTNFKVWEREKIYVANLQTNGRETISTALGAFNALVLQIGADDKVFNRWKPRVYLSDDERRLPLLFSLKLPQGELRADLVSVETISGDSSATAAPMSPRATAAPNSPKTPRAISKPKPYVDNQPLDSTLPFALGEKLTFEILRNGQKIGAANLQVKERKQFFGRDGVLLSANGSLSGEAHTIESYINPEFLVPYRQEIRLSGSLRGFNQTLLFEQDKGKASAERAANIDIPVGTHDFLSFFYALRAFHYSFGQNSPDVRAAVFFGNAPTVVSLKPKREKLDFNGQKVPTVALAVFTGNPQIDSLNFRLWLSDDGRRLPLRLTFNTPSGAFQANLIALQQ
jgi:hypothetical protein